MSSPRFIKLVRYDIDSSDIIFEVGDATTKIASFLKKSGFMFSCEITQGKDVITIPKLNQLGVGFIEFVFSAIPKSSARRFFGRSKLD